MDTRRSPLKLGIVAFAITFTLIVTTTLLGIGGVKAFNALTGTSPSPTASPSSPATESPTPSASFSQGSMGTYCYKPPAEQQNERPSKDVAAPGYMAGGGVTTRVVSPFDPTKVVVQNRIPLTTDAASVHVEVEPDWDSTVAVGKITWQEGIQYPGNQKAAERMFDCLITSTSLWQPRVSSHTLVNRQVAPITVNGMDGYKVTGRLKFDVTSLKKAKHEDITVVVVEAPAGPALFLSLVADNDEHAKAAATALAELKPA